MNADVSSVAQVPPFTGTRRQTISRSASRTQVAVKKANERNEAVEQLAKERGRALGDLSSRATRYGLQLERERWVLPMTGYRLTGRFGDASYLWASLHTGLDFAAPSGTPIRSIAAGTVTEAGWAGSYGYRTVVRLQDGTELWYCHQSRIGVSSGDQLASGEVIGLVGSTGNVTGPHLHLEVRPAGGDPVDPFTALLDKGLSP